MNILKKINKSLGLSEEPPKTPTFRPPYVPVTEPTSFSNFDRCLMNHLTIDLTPDFDAKLLKGSVIFEGEYTYQMNKDREVDLNAEKFELILDTRDLTIHSVEMFPTSKRKSQELNIKDVVRRKSSPKGAQQLDFHMGKQHAVFGTPLHIAFPSDFSNAIRSDVTKNPAKVAKRNFIIKVNYETATEGVCTAVQWLTPEQTKDKEQPFMFTQCQAIHCRSLLPCQDAPACKTTYSASVTVQSSMAALMSAQEISVERDDSGKFDRYLFDQPVPMPSYLIAIVVGKLESRDIGPRSRVWAEPSVVEAAAYEFAETESYLQAAEEICGPYVWGRYDLLVLPPSFPYGGMENPCLTFVTPTLLAGDRSLSNVVAHEIAHSWMGNLVTNATWEDFWMNEGFCVFVERRMIQRLFGDESESLKSAIGWQHLEDTVQEIGSDHQFTQLHITMDGIDPDDSFSSIPYEKGCAFLHYLERLVGGRDVFEPFIKAHVEQFKFNTVNIKEWKSFFIDYFRRRLSPVTLNEIQWDKWVHEPGMPPIEKPDFNSGLMKTALASADEWLTTGKSDLVSEEEGKKWSSDQKLVFLQHIVASVSDSENAQENIRGALQGLASTYGFANTKNAEVRFLWNMIGCKLGEESFYEDSVNFLLEQGRMKFVRPLYKALFASSDKGKELAVSTFTANAMSYHSIARKMVAKDLNVTLNA